MDTTKSGQGFAVSLGAGKTINGLEDGIVGMKAGETRELCVCVCVCVSVHAYRCVSVCVFVCVSMVLNMYCGYEGWRDS